MKFFKTIILLMVMSSFYLPANEKDTTVQKNGYWVGLGVGGNYFGPTFCTNLSFTINQNLFSIKYSKSDEFNLSFSGYDFEEPYLTLKEFGVLYGRIYRKSFILLSALAGISYLKGINRGRNIQYNDYETINISTLGFAFEAEVMFEFTNFIGLGILYYGNINKKKTFTGGMLRLKFGWF